MDRLKITRLLSCVLTGVLLFGTTAYASGDTNIRSYGKVQAVDDQGQSVVIDADDIRQNYAAILQIKNQLAGLEGKTLEWSDTMGTYVIVTYQKDQNGLVVSDSSGKPIIESEEAIGALGTADPTMVVENRTFSSLYAKTVYREASTTKNPGVEQNGTLVDILNNGWTADQIAGTPYYAVNDTKGTGSSTREKGGAIGGTRTHDLAFGAYNAQANTHNTKASLSPTNTVFDIGVNQSVTLPAGYYDQGVTIRTGVIDRQTVNWSPASKSTYTLEPGYYSGGTFTTDNAYQAGYTAGVAAGTSPASATVTYTVRHAHGEYCYPIPKGIYSSSEGHEADDDGHSNLHYWARYVTCSVCGKTFGHKSHNGWPSDAQCWGPYNAHLVNGRCRAKGYTCGKSTGNYTTTNISTLGSGDSILSANIQFN